MVVVSGLLYFLVTGLVIGLIAAAIMGDRGVGWIMSMVLGIVGSLVGSFLFGLLGQTNFGTITHIIVGIVGACIVLVVAGWMRGRRVI